MAKTIQQISETSWSVTEDVGPITTTYMVYDDDPNIDKYAHDFSRLSESDIDSIKESLNVRSGSQGDKGGLQYTFEGGASFPSTGAFSYQYSDDYYAIVISPTDNDGNSLANYFTSILGSVSAKVYITSNTNGVATVDVWDITSINTYSTDFSLDGTLIGGATNFTIGGNYSINIVFSGLDGLGGRGDLLVGGGGLHILTQPIATWLYLAQGFQTNYGTTSLSNGVNTMMLSLFYPATTFTITELSINVTTASTSAMNLKILVYSDDGYGYPRRKLIESSSLSLITTGAKIFTTSYTFTAGTKYWMGVIVDVSAGANVMQIGGSVLLTRMFNYTIAQTGMYIPFYSYNTCPELNRTPFTAGNMQSVAVYFRT